MCKHFEMCLKGKLSLRHIKLLLLTLTVTLVFMTLQYQVKIVSLLHKGVKQNINISGNTASFRDIKYEINISKGIYIGKTLGKTAIKTYTQTRNATNDNHTCRNVCRKYLYTTGNNTYTIENENLCSSEDSVKLIAMVHSATDNFERRTAIRQTWGNVSLFKSYNLRIAFVLGQSNNKSVQTVIEHENALHGDIVQGKFLDTYHNLTNKHVLGLRWVTEHCKTAKYVIKVDDDVFLNPFGLFRDLVTKHSNIRRTILCNVRLNGTDTIVRRGKWGIGDKLYRNLTYYPVTYCQGYVVIYSRDIVQEIYNAAMGKCTPFLWLDDVYVTGILANNVGNISHSGLKGILQHIIYIHASLRENMYKHWARILALTEKLRITSNKESAVKLKVHQKKKKP